MLWEKLRQEQENSRDLFRYPQIHRNPSEIQRHDKTAQSCTIKKKEKMQNLEFSKLSWYFWITYVLFDFVGWKWKPACIFLKQVLGGFAVDLGILFDSVVWTNGCLHRVEPKEFCRLLLLPSKIDGEIIIRRFFRTKQRNPSTAMQRTPKHQRQRS